jgi:transposase
VRKPLPAELPRIRQVYELPLEERHCACGCTLTEIGEEISEQLEVIPAQLRVIQHVRKTYACKGCEENIKTADKPPQLLPKSNASAATLAYTITAKYQDGLPLYRLSNIFQRAGIELSRQTLSDWVIKTAERLTPVMQLLQQRLHQGPVIHCDAQSACPKHYVGQALAGQALRLACKCCTSLTNHRKAIRTCGCSAAAPLTGRSSCFTTTAAAQAKSPCACSTAITAPS